MSAPRPPPDQTVPLDQILPPSIIKLIWAGEILLVLVIIAGFGMLLSRICSEIYSTIRRGESIQWFPTPKPIVKLTYFVPPAFCRYRREREGWKYWVPSGLLLLVLSAFMSANWAGGNHEWPTFTSFLITFAGFGAVFMMMTVSRERTGYSIAFYLDGIGSRSKGRKTPYGHYARVTVKNLEIRGATYVLVSFVAKRQDWLRSSTEYGFDATADINPLLSLLRNQGLPIEKEI